MKLRTDLKNTLPLQTRDGIPVTFYTDGNLSIQVYPGKTRAILTITSTHPTILFRLDDKLTHHSTIAANVAFSLYASKRKLGSFSLLRLNPFDSIKKITLPNGQVVMLSKKYHYSLTYPPPNGDHSDHKEAIKESILKNFFPTRYARNQIMNANTPDSNTNYADIKEGTMERLERIKQTSRGFLNLIKPKSRTNPRTRAH